MALQLGRTLGRGGLRALSASGIALLTLTLVVQYAFVSSLNTVLYEVFPADVQGDLEIGLTLPVSGSIAGVLTAVAFLATVVLYVVAPRTLARDTADLNSLSARLFTRRIGRAALSALLAGLLVATSVTLGSVLIVPGLFLAVSFAFVPFAIAVEDRRTIPALRRSWDLARGNRWRLLVVVVVLVAFHGIVSVVSAAFTLAAPAVGQAISVGASSVVLVLGVAVLAEAFRQLRDAEAGGL